MPCMINAVNIQTAHAETQTSSELSSSIAGVIGDKISESDQGKLGTHLHLMNFAVLAVSRVLFLLKFDNISESLACTLGYPIQKTHAPSSRTSSTPDPAFKAMVHTVHINPFPAI